MSLSQPCPVMNQCGGCPLFSLTAHEELEVKHVRLTQLQSALKLPAIPLELKSNHCRTDYRNRIRLRIDDEGRIAFFNHEKSPQCAVLVPTLRNYLEELREWANRHPRALSELAYLEARAPDLECTRGLYGSAKPNTSVLRSVLDELAADIAHHVVTIDTDPVMKTQRFGIDGKTYQRVPLDAFLQVNFDVNRMLAEHVVAGAVRRNVATFADLYCGSGNFTLPLAAAGLHGCGVETVPSCANAANRAACEQGLASVRFHPGDAIAWAHDSIASDRRFDLVVLDPPRAGLRSGLDDVSNLAHHCIAYCSCNPETLLRDLSVLTQLGWHVEELTGFDMFPGTRHLEVVAWLTL